MAQPVPSRNRARVLVARSLAGCAVAVGFMAAAVGPASAADGRRVSDTENTRTVYLVVGGLVLVGCALLAFTMWFWRSTKSDHEALGPLEVLGDRRFRGRPPEQRLAMLDTARPVGAIPLGSIHGRDDGLVIEPAEIPVVQPEEEPAAEPSEPVVLEPIGAEDAEDPVVGVVGEEAAGQAIGSAREPVIELVESVTTDDAEPDVPLVEQVAETETFEAPATDEEIAEPELADGPDAAVVEPRDESDAADAAVPVAVPMNGEHPSDDATEIEVDVVPVPEPVAAAQPGANGVELMVEAPVMRPEAGADVPGGSVEEEAAATAVTLDTIEPKPVETESGAATEPTHDDRGTVRSWLSSMWRR